MLPHTEDNKEQDKKERTKSEREEKWEKVKEKMRKRSNPLDLAHRSEVAQAYKEYLETLPSHLQQLWLLILPSKRTLPGIPYAIPRKKIPELLRENPEFYKKYREMVVGEEKG